MKLIGVVLAVLVLTVARLSAKFAIPEEVPVSRLVEIATENLAKDPASAEANYAMARIHYLAFACGTEKLRAYTKGRKPLTIGPHQHFTDPNPVSQRQELPENEAADHIAQALRYFREAKRLAPRNILYRLGYTSLLEQGGDWLRSHPQAPVPEEIRAVTPAQVRGEYEAIWREELPIDLEARSLGTFDLLDIISYEAGQAYVRLAEKEKSLPKPEQETLLQVQTSLASLAQTPRAVTPIIFGRQPVRSVQDLLSPSTTVEFPLRGWGFAERWPWVKPETAFLVWNPSGSGRIESGAQMFGSYTWELFWRSGYEALAVLDVNGDGVLEGDELNGLAVWFDRNGNGVSDPGEVCSLSEIGVVALATCATSTEHGTPSNARGVTFADGRKLPTWDWVVEPAPAKEGPSRNTLAITHP